MLNTITVTVTLRCSENMSDATLAKARAEVVACLQPAARDAVEFAVSDFDVPDGEELEFDIELR